MNEALRYCSLQANDELITYILKHFAQVKDQTIKLTLPSAASANRTGQVSLLIRLKVSGLQNNLLFLLLSGLKRKKGVPWYIKREK